MKRYLAIDYGRSHLGLAYAQTPLAEPLTQLPNTSLQKVVLELRKIIHEKQIDTIVVGISEGKMAEETKEFASNLEKELEIPVVFHDETLSSHTATKYLIKSGAKQKKRQDKQHQTAAAVILQDYLDQLDISLIV
jgi:putative Holliday junction resolvase